MALFASFIIKHKKAVIATFVIATVLSAICFLTVEVNYDMTDYLPSDAGSTKALEIMNKEFQVSLPNAFVTISDVSLPEAIVNKHALESLEYVSEVRWLDDMIDTTIPLEMGNKDIIDSFYRDGNARYSVVIEKGYEKQGISSILESFGERAAITGDAADIEFVQTTAEPEILYAILIVLPIILLILILSTTSWIEPLLFLAAIGVSVVINMGTNALFGSVSFLTNSVTPILQLAVSLDYAIFLLHSFAAHRKSGKNIDEAMQSAIRESFSTISASASTTLFGFMALLLMEFSIGADLGLSLAKGIVFSFVSVMVFLPAMTICTYKAIDKARHRELMPSFSNIHSVLRRIAIPTIIIIALIIIPVFLGQSRTDFMYGFQSAAEKMRGESGGTANDGGTVVVLLVPKGDVSREEQLSDEIMELAHVTSVMSYAKTVGSAIPPEFLDSSITDQFYSGGLARIVVSTDTPNEGNAAFETVERITATAETYYPGQVHTAGHSATLYDIKNVVQNDNRVTNIAAILAIFIVLLLTFKSAILPFLLLFTIEAAIWINLSIPYFAGTPINYMGYLVLNTVQLGATVDYAILLTMTYMRNRQTMPKHEAIHKSLGSSFRAIIISATTMAAAGFTLSLTSSNPIIGDIGYLLGRGTLLSMLMVVVFLPAMLTRLDGAIGKLTLKSRFLLE